MTIACLGLIGVASVSAGCMGWVPVPDQSEYAPLASLADSGQAVARLYVAPIPFLDGIAVHPWFVVKRADATQFDRWEVMPDMWLPLFAGAEARYGQVFLNLDSPEFYPGYAGSYVIAELIGSEAEPIVAFIEFHSPEYSCRARYVLLPGPNSSTYAQWVLDNAGWDVDLPAAALGKDFRPLCP
jgi:hypothetical protein